MAWTNTAETILAVPFLVRKLTVVPDSTTATAVAHGGPTGTTPNMVLLEPTQADPTATETTVTAKDGTNVTFDVEGSGARFIAYVFFFPQSRQDGQSINQDNNT